METRFSLKYVLRKSSLVPNRLQNVRAEGWGNMLKEMRKFWLEGKETTLETSHWKNADGYPKGM